MLYRIIFMGSGDFAAIILKKLAESDFCPAAVFTQPDKPAGRHQILSPSPAKIIAQKYGIEILEPKSLKTKEVEEVIKTLAPDLIIVADYGKIIPKNILDIPKFGALNIHPSLLPRHRGATPIEYTILEGDEETGVTIIKMDEQVDHGPVVSQISKVKSSNLTCSQLLKILAETGGELLLKTLPQWLSEKIKLTPQNESLATFTKILTRDDGKIDWKNPAEEIERKIRAMEGWPGTWTIWSEENKKIKILKAEIINDKNNLWSGTVYVTPDNKMTIACGKDSLIINELQIEGKNKITGQEFLRGYPKIIGKTLG